MNDRIIIHGRIICLTVKYDCRTRHNHARIANLASRISCRIEHCIRHSHVTSAGNNTCTASDIKCTSGHIDIVFPRRVDATCHIAGSRNLAIEHTTGNVDGVSSSLSTFSVTGNNSIIRSAESSVIDIDGRTSSITCNNGALDRLNNSLLDVGHRVTANTNRLTASRYNLSATLIVRNRQLTIVHNYLASRSNRIAVQVQGYFLIRGDFPSRCQSNITRQLNDTVFFRGQLRLCRPAHAAQCQGHDQRQHSCQYLFHCEHSSMFLIFPQPTSF